MRQLRRWHIYENREELDVHAAQALLRAAAQAIQARGEFHVVLAGGNTPRAVYTRLSKAAAGWSHWHVYFGDERCLPRGDPGRNDAMARNAWLDRVSIPRPQIHGIPAEESAPVAVARYSETLARIEPFDVVLLGVGEDGHTASLFPGHTSDRDESVFAVDDSPKPPPRRITLGAARLSRSRQVLFIVSGSRKRQAVTAWRSGLEVPASTITPSDGVDILVDASAWPDTSP
jgi:6-phosphogluconolactonase